MNAIVAGAGTAKTTKIGLVRSTPERPAGHRPTLVPQPVIDITALLRADIRKRDWKRVWEREGVEIDRPDYVRRVWR